MKIIEKMFPIRNNYEIHISTTTNIAFLEEEFKRLSREYLDKYSIFKHKSVKVNRSKIYMYMYIMTDDKYKVRSMLVLDINRSIIIRYLFGELNDFHYLIAKITMMGFKNYSKIIYMFPSHKEILKIANMHGFEVAKTEGSLICSVKKITF